MFQYSGLYVASCNKKDYIKAAQVDNLRAEPLKVTEVENGIILPAKPMPGIPWGGGGVQREDFSFVLESETPNIFGGDYDYDHSTINKLDKTVVYMGPFLSHWGHFICDQISRLWFILQEPEKYIVAYCGWNWGNKQTALWGNFLELMHMLGLNDDQLLDVQTPIQFKKVIIPDLSFRRGEFYTKEYLNIFKKISSTVHPDDFEYCDKIYYTRTHFAEAQKKERGEDELEKLFENNGYKIIAPEQISLREQVYYYQYAKHIAAISGSITHSILFAREDLEITILNKMNLLNGYQLIVDNMIKAKITYVDAYKCNWQVCFGLGPFWVGITNFLKQYAEYHNLRIPVTTAKSIFRDFRNRIWYIRKFIATYINQNNRKELLSQRHSVVQQRKANKS